MKKSLLNSWRVPPYYNVTSRKYFYLGLMVLVSFSIKLVLRKSSFVVTIVYDVMAGTYWRANCESHSMECLLIHGLVICILKY